MEAPPGGCVPLAAAGLAPRIRKGRGKRALGAGRRIFFIFFFPFGRAQIA